MIQFWAIFVKTFFRYITTKKKYINYSLSKAKALLYTIAVTQHIALSAPALVDGYLFDPVRAKLASMQTHDLTLKILKKNTYK